MGKVSETDAYATMRTAIIAGVAQTCQETGMRPGEAMTNMTRAILDHLLSPAMAWACVEAGRASLREDK